MGPRSGTRVAGRRLYGRECEQTGMPVVIVWVDALVERYCWAGLLDIRVAIVTVVGLHARVWAMNGCGGAY